MSAGRTVARAALVAVIVVAADQITKAIVRDEIKPGETVDVLPGIDLVHTRTPASPSACSPAAARWW